jgi:hypothetical protein
MLITDNVFNRIIMLIIIFFRPWAFHLVHGTHVSDRTSNPFIRVAMILQYEILEDVLITLLLDSKIFTMHIQENQK